MRAIVTESAQKLKSDVAKTGEKILRFFSRLRPSITYDPSDNSWNGSLDAVKSGEADHTPLLVEAIDGLARLAADAKKPTALVIDEFQKVIQLGGQERKRRCERRCSATPILGSFLPGRKPRC